MKNKLKYILIVFMIALAFAGCRREEIEPTETPIPPARATPTPTEYYGESPTNKPVFADITDFESGSNAYESGFANYKETRVELYKLSSEIAEIPDIASKGYYMSGENQDESLIMYLTKNIVALPNTEYTVTIDFDIGTNMQSQIDAESEEDQAMYIKSGVSPVPFQLIIDEDDYFRSNWNLGYLSGNGSETITLGTTEKVNSQDDSYQYKNFSGSYRVETAEDGLICILIAAESNLLGTSYIYFDNIVIEIAEI